MGRGRGPCTVAGRRRPVAMTSTWWPSGGAARQGAGRSDRGRHRAMEYFTTGGPVRGCCGHMHRTAGAAHRCATRDDARAKLQGRDCYSDRRARRVSSREELRGYDVTQGPGEPLATMDEYASLRD